MKIKIVVDSGCDITQEEGKKLGIKIVPLKTTFGDTEYLDGVDLTQREFFEKLIETDVFPSTSQVAPFEYEEAFKEALKEADVVLCITVSSKLSGCYQSAVIASESFSGKVYLVDSGTVCIGQRLLVEYACKLLENDLDINDVVDDLNESKSRIKLIALLGTLEYLKKGGRISAAAATFGTMLSIKPVISVEDGEIKILGKARGSKNGNNMLTQEVEKAGGIDFTMPFCAAFSGLSDSLLNKYIDDHKGLFEEHIKREDIPVSMIGSTIGTHAGPDAIAVSFFAPKR